MKLIKGFSWKWAGKYMGICRTECNDETGNGIPPKDRASWFLNRKLGEKDLSAWLDLGCRSEC